MGIQKAATKEYTTPFNETDRIIESSQVKVDVVNVVGIDMGTNARV
jgi:hypothetical protein